MFVIGSLLLGATAGYFLSFYQMLGVILLCVVSYIVLHKMKVSGRIIATGVWFMVYFLVAMFISAGFVTLVH